MGHGCIFDQIYLVKYVTVAFSFDSPVEMKNPVPAS